MCMCVVSRRRVLQMKATVWRALMGIGMKFHHLATPRPPRPNFKIVVPSRLSTRGGTFKLIFYVPDSYYDADDDYRYPVVVNFHGGGFTLGTGTDDARWASTVVSEVDAVFVSVEYRLAPEFPFSVGVEDGTDALIYLASHASELHLDNHRMALSGFSAGGNFAFTVPLMLHDLKTDSGKRTLQDCKAPYQRPLSSSRSTEDLSRPQHLRTQTSTTSIYKLTDLEPTELEISQKIPDLTLCAIVSFYPPTDFRTTREDKKATNPAPEKNLPSILTSLFDESYMYPPSTISLDDPYLSPACASSLSLKLAYPQDIILYTCEHDMLNLEGIAFGERLKGPGIEKSVHGGEIKSVPHAFDKKPNPMRFPKSADRCYSETCAELRRVFGGRSSVDERRLLERSEDVERFDGDDALEDPVEGSRIHLERGVRGKKEGGAKGGNGKGVKRKPTIRLVDSRGEGEGSGMTSEERLLDLEVEREDPFKDRNGVV